MLFSKQASVKLSQLFTWCPQTIFGTISGINAARFLIYIYIYFLYIYAKMKYIEKSFRSPPTHPLSHQGISNVFCNIIRHRLRHALGQALQLSLCQAFGSAYCLMYIFRVSVGRILSHDIETYFSFSFTLLTLIQFLVVHIGFVQYVPSVGSCY